MTTPTALDYLEGYIGWHVLMQDIGEPCSCTAPGDHPADAWPPLAAGLPADLPPSHAAATFTALAVALACPLAAGLAADLNRTEAPS
jgi:hypothetical protein